MTWRKAYRPLVFCRMSPAAAHIHLSQAQRDSGTQQGISFVKGQYYVRIAAYNENVSLDLFTQYIDDRISAGSDPFPEFARLPDIGEVVQTRFVREAYRGLDFVNNVIEREYIVGGEKTPAVPGYR